MKKSIWVVLVIVVVVILAVVGAFALRGNTNTEDANNVSGEQEVKEMVELLELNPSYRLEDGINDKCFVVGFNNEIYNKDVLDTFLDDAMNDSDAMLRVLQEDASGEAIVMDISTTEDLIKVSYRDPATQIISTNEYTKKDGYEIVSTTVLLEDGTNWNGCSISNKENKEEIVLFGYIVIDESKDPLQYEEKLPEDVEGLDESGEGETLEEIAE